MRAKGICSSNSVSSTTRIRETVTPRRAQSLYCATRCWTLPTSDQDLRSRPTNLDRPWVNGAIKRLRPTRCGRKPLTLRQMRNLRPLALRLAGDWRPRQLGRARLHHKIVVERVPRPLHVGRRRLLILVPHIVADETAGDAELHVGLQELVVLHVDL